MHPRICESTFLSYTVLELAGEFDMASRPLLAQMRRTAVAVPPGRLVVDLSRVTFLDCSTLRELVTIVDCVSPGARMVCPDGNILRLLRMTGVLQTHRVLASLVEATLPVDPEPAASAEAP